MVRIAAEDWSTRIDAEHPDEDTHNHRCRLGAPVAIPLQGATLDPPTLFASEMHAPVR